MWSVEELSQPEFIFEQFKKSLKLPQGVLDTITKIKALPEWESRVASSPEAATKYNEIVTASRNTQSPQCIDYYDYIVMRDLIQCRYNMHWFDLGTFAAKVACEFDPKTYNHMCGPERLPYPFTLFT